MRPQCPPWGLDSARTTLLSLIQNMAEPKKPGVPWEFHTHLSSFKAQSSKGKCPYRVEVGASGHRASFSLSPNVLH